MNKAGIGIVCALAVAAAAATTAVAQELSEKSVKTFMNYAWSLVPSQFTPPSGKTIVIDKKKKDEILIPVDAAREVIRIGRLSAHAQICDLKAEQVCNYQSMMRREVDKKSWTDQQLVYISQLHLTTVMMLTGKIKLVEKDGDKEVQVEEKASPVAQTCTQEQKDKVSEVIYTYVKAGPELKGGACEFKK
ncbi:MAG: hypothetical protein NW217_11000 [Hyphomicrobiaceae bacterium]|nr:hypothetical protein [Hyphomicrobiaceae bacterium]